MVAAAADLGVRDRRVRGVRDRNPVAGRQPPDLEDLLRRSQDKLKTVLPGGSFGGRSGSPAALVVALFLWGISGFFVVQPGELGVVQRFGKYVRDAPAGWGYHWPYPVETRDQGQYRAHQPIDVGMRIVDDVRRGSATSATCRKRA